MKPLPNLNDEPAMIERGKRSILGSARNEAAEALRDACTFVQSASWDELSERAERAVEAAGRLQALAAMWESINGTVETAKQG